MQALDGVRVLDLGTYIAGPFCATVLGEFGADIIKVERPGSGDHLRRFGTETDCGDTLVWLSESRNKRSVTLDLGTPKGRELLRELIAEVDVVIENFRPGVLERWGLDYETMKELNPRVILVRVSAYGQTGPNRDLPGFARIAHAFSGLAYLAGEPDGPPVTPGSTSLADYVTGLYGVVGVLLALRAREATGTGQCVDLALYETIFRMLDELAPAYQQFGFVRERMGADTVNVLPHSHYRTSDGRWIAIACSNDDMFARLARAMERPELADGRRVRSEGGAAGRPRRGQHARRRVGGLAHLRRGAGPVPGGRGAVRAAQLHRRHLRGPAVRPPGDHRHQGLADRPAGRARHPAGALGHPRRDQLAGPGPGADTDDVLAELLHRTPEQIAELRADGVI